MLHKMAGLGGLFAQKTDHPLADPRELKRIIGELPKDNAFKTLDEISDWLHSLQAADEFPVDRLYEAVRQLDLAAQPHLQRLSREYLNTARLNRSDEKRLWSINCGFWTLLAAAYEYALDAAAASKKEGRPAEPFKIMLASLTTRLLGALGAVLKWERLHYGQAPAGFWLRLGKALAAAEEAGVETRACAQFGGVSSARQEYIKVLAFQAASTDSLLPLEIELSERVIAHFLSAFVLTDAVEQDSVYWVDLQSSQPPRRLALAPKQARPTQRFFKPGKASEAMLEMLQELERGGGLPPELKLGEAFWPRQLMPVLRHLAGYLAPVPPQRRHVRHHVKHRVSIVYGLDNAFAAFAGQAGVQASLPVESWVVENVSHGGVGALLNTIPGEWLKVGAPIAMQPEGGDNWLLGVVRRYQRESAEQARVGIETVARQALAVELKSEVVSSYVAVVRLPALLIEKAGDADEVMLMLPPSSFNVRQNLEYGQDGQRFLLAPVAQVEQTPEFELARYRRRRIG